MTGQPVGSGSVCRQRDGVSSLAMSDFIEDVFDASLDRQERVDPPLETSDTARVTWSDPQRIHRKLK